MGACRELPDENPSQVDFNVRVLVESITDLEINRGTQPALAQVIAKRQVDKILRRLGGGVFYLPKCYDYTREAREARNITIQEQYNAGAKVPDLSRSFRLTPKQIYQILKKRRKA